MFSSCSKLTDSVSRLVSVLMCMCPHLWLSRKLFELACKSIYHDCRRIDN